MTAPAARARPGMRPAATLAAPGDQGPAGDDAARRRSPAAPERHD